jgi:hypothetical protein
MDNLFHKGFIVFLLNTFFFTYKNVIAYLPEIVPMIRNLTKVPKLSPMRRTNVRLAMGWARRTRWDTFV